MLFLSAFFWRLFFWSFQFIHHFKHLHASVFHLKGCVCQRNFGCISLRLMLYAPPMSLLKSACKRQICWCGRGSTLRVQSIKKSPQTQSYQGFASFWIVVPVAGLEPARHRWRWILSYLLHREYKRTQPLMEVANGHQKRCKHYYFWNWCVKKLRFVCHFRTFQFWRKFWILEGHRRDVTPKRSTTAHAIDS